MDEAGLFQGGGGLGGAIQRFVGASEFYQQKWAVVFGSCDSFDEAALLAEPSCFLETRKRAGRPVEGIAGEDEVDLSNGSVPASTLLDEQGQRPLHFSNPADIAEVCAGLATECACLRRVGQAKRVSDGAGAVRGRNR